MSHRGPTRVKRVRAALQRRAWLLLGVVAVLPLVAVDPALIVLLYDGELLALLGAAGAAVVRGDLRSAWLGLLSRPFVTDVHAALRYTRACPRSLLHA